jgi:hypothetical protein
MSKNAITARIEFSFQGQNYAYTSQLDLDHLLNRYDELPMLHAIMATQHGIDTYSYLYEVMQEADIEFVEPLGYAVNYLIEGEFDIAALARNWQAQKALALLQPIARRELGIDDLDQQPALKQALIAAYNLGRNV